MRSDRIRTKTCTVTLTAISTQTVTFEMPLDADHDEIVEEAYELADLREATAIEWLTDAEPEVEIQKSCG